jgi:nicotinate (nicotinamide) nucleotide adenylyltransferase
MTRLGVLGGTFDPPHIAHVVIADRACGQLNLERVLFVPAGQPPHKLDRPISPVEHRVTMTQLAIAGEARFALSRADVDRPGPHYTADMLALVGAAYPRVLLIPGNIAFLKILEKTQLPHPSYLIAAAGFLCPEDTELRTTLIEYPRHVHGHDHAPGIIGLNAAGEKQSL